MPKKTSKARKTGASSQETEGKGKRKTSSAKANRSAANEPEASHAPSDPKFVQDLLTRGEAAELTKDGKLPLSATHIIQKNNPDGSVQVKRARFKLF